MSGAITAYIIDIPMTLFNVADWTGFARAMLLLTLLGGIIISIIFAIERGFRSFLRTWVGLPLCGMFGYGYMHIRLHLTYFLADHLGFIGRMLNIPIGLLEFFILIQFFFGIIAFLLPMGEPAGLSKTGRATPNGSEGTSDDISFVSDDSFPTYVSDDEGNHYSVRRDGAFIYVSLPGGEYSTKWEYIRGQSYFHLGGKRLYPN